MYPIWWLKQGHITHQKMGDDESEDSCEYPLLSDSKDDNLDNQQEFILQHHMCQD